MPFLLPNEATLTNIVVNGREVGMQPVLVKAGDRIGVRIDFGQDGEPRHAEIVLAEVAGSRWRRLLRSLLGVRSGVERTHKG